MRRYPVGRQELIDLINAERPTWIPRAQARTAQYAAARDFTDGSDFWGEIKNVYIRLQHEKCAYCETRLQGPKFAIKVHEVEHFRPKQSVKAWPNTNLEHLKDFVAPCPVGDGSATGYYRLAYHPFNYAIACTRCNSTLKSNYFPVRGQRQVHGNDPSHMYGEDPLLVYPISDLDDDPQALITFRGVLAVPKHLAGPEQERALITIRFFQLNHEDLTTRRAAILAPLWLNLEALSALPDGPLAHEQQMVVDRACGPHGEFSACMNAFRELFAVDREAARKLGALANRLADPTIAA